MVFRKFLRSLDLADLIFEQTAPIHISWDGHLEQLQDRRRDVGDVWPPASA